MELVEKHRSHKGSQEVYKHFSETTNCTMQFAVYLPDNSKDCPLLYFLSGITCTEQNFIQKSGFQQFASKHQVAVVVPDTSPRGEGIPDNEDYKLGCGAGFYLNATREPWSKNYKMYDYITKELPELISKNLNLVNQKLEYLVIQWVGEELFSAHLKMIYINQSQLSHQYALFTKVHFQKICFLII